MNSRVELKGNFNVLNPVFEFPSNFYGLPHLGGVNLVT